MGCGTTKRFNKMSVLISKILQTPVTKVRGRHERTDKTQGELKILSRYSIPKISLFFPSPFPSYFQNTLESKNVLISQPPGKNLWLHPGGTT